MTDDPHQPLAELACGLAIVLLHGSGYTSFEDAMVVLVAMIFFNMVAHE